jgi:hypothetical protein
MDASGGGFVGNGRRDLFSPDRQGAGIHRDVYTDAAGDADTPRRPIRQCRLRSDFSAPQATEQRIETLATDPAEDLVPDPDGGRAGAVAQAIHRLQADRAVGGGPMPVDTQAALSVFFEGHAAPGLTGFGTAHLHHGLPGRGAAEVMVEADDAVDLGPALVEGRGDEGNGLWRHPADGVLDGVEDGQQRARAGCVGGQGVLYSLRVRRRSGAEA